jgi:hypothetical protein
MQNFYKKSISAVLFFIATIIVQHSFGQSLLLLHDKLGNKDCTVRTGKNIKIETTNGQVIKGKIIEIKDSSIVIDNVIKTEINISNIKYLYYRNSTGWKTAGGAVLAFYSAAMTAIVIIGLTESTKANAVPNAVNDNPIPSIAVIGAVGLPVLYGGTYYELLHKKKFDTQFSYDLTIVKHK